MDSKQKIIVIAGPTASGKSGLAIEIAKRISGEVISADSMQIYKKLDIGTAKVLEKEADGVPHHLIDVVDFWEEFSVSDFCEIAKQKINEIISRGNVPIICGGTGLYIDSLLFERSFASTAKSEKYREELKKIASEKGEAHLYEMLKEIDPKSASEIHQNNLPRIIRALEIFHLTGKKKSQTKEEKIEKYNHSAFYIEEDREVLYDRINQRVDIMEREGLFEEFASVTKDHPNAREYQSMKAIGYREIFSFADGTWSREETIDKIKQFSRNYAKRQFTWFRNAGVCTPIPKGLSKTEKAEFVIEKYLKQ